MLAPIGDDTWNANNTNFEKMIYWNTRNSWYKVHIESDK